MPQKTSESISEFSEKRLWGTLDSISQDIKHIQVELKEITRIGERVQNHHDILSRHTQILDKIDARVKENELWRANFGDKRQAEETVKELRTRIKELETLTNTSKGEKKVWEPVFRWGFSLFASLLVIFLANK